MSLYIKSNEDPLSSNNKLERIVFDSLNTEPKDMEFIEAMYKNVEELKKELY